MHASLGQNPDPHLRPAVLLVEDDVLLRMATGDDLRDAGFLVLEAASADEALTVLRGSTRIDVVMTDIRMPGSMDGAALARLVRDTWPDMKIIVISASTPGWPTGTLVDAFFGKPVDVTRLIGRLAQLLPRPHP